MASNSGPEPAQTAKSGSWFSPTAQRLTDDESAIQVLRTGSAAAIVFLLVFLLYDHYARHGAAFSSTLLHWITVAGAMGFFAATWTRAFSRFWKLWNLLFCVLLISIFIVISAETGEGDSRFAAVLLIPIATAAFVNWGWRWQAAMGLACIVLYGFAEMLVPISAGSFNRWMALLAAVMLAEGTSFFVGIYRQRLDAQVDQLVQAAKFRETQIATMAHDIRSPVAAIAGFVDLLQDQDLSEHDRKEILARISTTAWSMDLTVSNILDLYQISGGPISSAPMRLDPNRVIADAASACTAQANSKGLKIAATYGEVARGNFDPRHLERIARNMLAYSIARLEDGEITLRTRGAANGIIIETEDGGPTPTDDELATLVTSTNQNGNHSNKVTLGLYIARALAETVGGRVKLHLPSDNRIKLIAEIPSAHIEPKPKTA